ncbi:geranylgeranyl reductase family protein [Prauserella sediminis]|uniref:Geranylgeranyl reductase family protein n=1 Tax=Prauserella sediminis TaxID=577680 RepID=A0A839XSH6_9PSEU|nr:geranylgeranyl reductase family protein [Prauserella sediminis]MBB3663573.1 geranylgeranyl reductase family protein [Prauserella sediminis]
MVDPPSAQVWDVVVVGAGPAGASAARVAAESGRDVLLLERAEVPRYKTCGGGLVGCSQDMLPPGLTLDVKDEVDRVTFGMDGRNERTKESRGPKAKMVFRSDFDAALTSAAAKAGASVRDRTAVQAIEECDHEVLLRLSGGDRIRARAVVGADGSASRVAKFVGVRYRQVDLALELELPVDARTAEAWRGRALMEWGPFAGSFGWVFPKGDSCSVGVVGSRAESGRTREYLRTFLQRHDFDGIEPIHDTGHLTRCREPDSPLARERVLVAGDAAGLLDPWLREGISFALRSGALCGEAAARVAAAEGPSELRGATDRYERAVTASLGEEMTASEKLSAIFARRPGLVHTAVTRVPGVWRKIDDYLTGRAAIPDLVGGPLVRPVVDVVKALS